MSQEVDELQKRIAFGMDVEGFLNSAIGRFLVSRAEEEISLNVERLKEADAENPKAIRELQNNIYRAESIQRWLAEAIQDGWQAEQAFVQND